MTLIKLNIKSIKELLSTTALLAFCLISNLAYADEANTGLNKMCDRQSILIAAKLRSNSKNELSAQDMSMIRLGAINGCIETYKRVANSSEAGKFTSAKTITITKSDTENNQEGTRNKKESIFDRLLRTKPKKDINPMQKKHRTGGK